MTVAGSIQTLGMIFNEVHTCKRVFAFKYQATHLPADPVRLILTTPLFFWPMARFHMLRLTFNHSFFRKVSFAV